MINRYTNITIKLCLFSLILVVMLLPFMAQANGSSEEPAAGNNDDVRILPECAKTGDCNVDDFVIMFMNLTHFFLGLVALVAMYYFIMGGFTLIISSGKPEKIQLGKSMIVNSLVGIFMVLAAWVIINTIYIALTDGSAQIFGSPWWQLPPRP